MFVSVGIKKNLIFYYIRCIAIGGVNSNLNKNEKTVTLFAIFLQAIDLKRNAEYYLLLTGIAAPMQTKMQMHQNKDHQ